MTSDLQESFTDAPPHEGLLPYSTKAAILVSRAMQYAGEQSDAMAIAAYKLISEGILRPSIKQLEDCMLAMDDVEIEQINDYLNRVIDRKQRSKVSLPETPGK